MENLSVSVLLSVYSDEGPAHVESAIESIFDQTHIPREFVIVKDGPLSSKLEQVLRKWKLDYPSIIKFVELEENRGLGKALQIGVQSCSGDLIARMDADDIAHPERLEMQLKFFEEHPDADVVGGYIAEFNMKPSDANRVRTVPTDPTQIEKKARFRCPMNHPTVTFRREAVLDVGSYRDLRSMQDYDLWVRMLMAGKVLYNIPQVLVYARAGQSLYKRRGGLDYLRIEYGIQREFFHRGFISFPVLVLNIIVRTTLRLLPTQLRSRLYTAFLRNSSTEGISDSKNISK